MGIDPGNTVRYRYPGTKFFEPDQHNIFFGREQETSDLIHSIKAHDVFVIFADSGIGKTSLLNAGLIPELEKENIETVHFRFQDVNTPPLKTIVKKLSEYCSQPDLLSDETKQKLWKLFKCCDFKSKIPLFVLDQFEEFFNHPKQDKEDCVSELADLINDYLPDYIREEMREKFREKDPSNEELKYYTPTHVKMLFLIRADKLKLLDDLSKKIPLILRNRFHLKPLNTQQAEQAIVRPAGLPQNGFASPAFSFQPEAVKAISNYLRNEEGEVESFQLQLLCQELEKKIICRNEKDQVNADLMITEAELGGDAGMDNITKNYYTNQLDSIPDKAMRSKAVELIEDKLIVDERRISLPEVLLLSQGYPKELLDFLLNTTRLIRVDNDRYVEISHDRLLSSILKSRSQREEEERKLNAAKELQKLKEQEEEKTRLLQKQKEEEIKNLELVFLKDKVRKARRLKIYLIALIVLFIGFLYAAIDASKANAEAKMALAHSHRARGEFKEADSVLNTGSWNLLSLLNFYHIDSLKNLKRIVTAEKAEKQNFLNSIKTGDSLWEDASAKIRYLDSLVYEKVENINKVELMKMLDWGSLRKAREAYLAAQQSNYQVTTGEEGAGDKLQDVDKQIAELFGDCMLLVNEFVGAKQYETAKAMFQKCEKLYGFAVDTARNIQLNIEDTLFYSDIKKNIINEK